jgi:hypothetical protein
MQESIPIGRYFLATTSSSVSDRVDSHPPSSSQISKGEKSVPSKLHVSTSRSTQSLPRPPISSPTSATSSHSSSSSKLSSSSYANAASSSSSSSNNNNNNKDNNNKARKVSLSPSRFKDEKESVEEATARRLAYKEKCEKEILEFQQSLLLEENVSVVCSSNTMRERGKDMDVKIVIIIIIIIIDTCYEFMLFHHVNNNLAYYCCYYFLNTNIKKGEEDLSYLKVQPRSNAIRRSASLDRERLEADSS